ncbi:hypothetical protein CRI70_07840 [Streptomyces sp. Ru87]|nr:hypothetical protein CRI70_07840 [Streptomyces sp. Ru87]
MRAGEARRDVPAAVSGSTAPYGGAAVPPAAARHREYGGAPGVGGAVARRGSARRRPADAP